MVSRTSLSGPYDDDVPVDETDQLLVAYLDGELADGDRLELEARLVSEQGLRRRLSHLQSGWELLDYLPPTSVTDDFARTTIEMVAANESTMLSVQKKRMPWKRITWVTAIVIASTALGFAGYALPVALEERQFEQQLTDLPIAENLDAFLVEIDLQVIEQLANDRSWQDSIAIAIESGSIYVSKPISSPEGASEVLVSTLNAAERRDKLLLSANWERFSNLADARKQQLRNRYAEVAATSDPTLTLNTLVLFAQWFNQLSPQDRDQLLNAPSEAKLPLINSLTQKMSRRWLREYGNAISEGDRDLIYDCLKLVAQRRLARFADDRESQEPSKRNKYFDQFLNDDPATFLPALSWSWRLGMMGRPRTEAPDPVADRLIGLLSDSELNDIEGIMSPRSLSVLGTNARSLEDRRKILHEWCMDIIVQKSPRFDTPERMLQHYQRIPAEFRQRLDLQTPEEIVNQLRGRGVGWPRQR